MMFPLRSVRFTILSLFVLLPCITHAYKGANAKFFPADEVIPYKTVDGVEMMLHVFYPNSKKPSKPTPAIAMFHGGGFSKGSPGQFFYFCDYVASRGMVGVSVQYRKQGDKIGCVMDGKTAMRYLYQHADKLGIDRNRIAAGGGSAGGCLAAALSTSKVINDPDDDTSIPAAPKALVLFNPVYHWTAGGKYSAEFRNDFTPMKNIHADMAPALVISGDNDKHLPEQRLKEFQKKMQDVGARSDLEIYPGEKHAFFTKKRQVVIETLTDVDEFLTSLGFMTGKPTVEAWEKNK